jgi:hypothetical protein
VIPLGIVDAALAEQAGGMRIFDKLSDGFLAHSPCDSDDSLDDQPILRIDAEIPNELAVDFKVVEREILE